MSDFLQFLRKRPQSVISFPEYVEPSSQVDVAAKKKCAADISAISSIIYESSPAKRFATLSQRNVALAITVAMVLTTLCLLPFAQVRLPKIPSFMPIYQTTLIGTYAITAYLIYGHYLATTSKALLYLSAACLYTAAVLIIQFLSLPGVFVEGTRLIGGPQTAIWLWFFWHAGPAVGILLFSWHEFRGHDDSNTDPTATFRLTVIILLMSLAATATMVTLGHDWLPVLDINDNFSGITSSGIAPALQIVLIFSLFLLWKSSQFRSVLHVWIGVALTALLCDNLITMAGADRLSLGWYLGRLGALISAIAMMIVYLKEINTSHQQSMLRESEIRSQAVELSELHRRKDEFLAMLSHELRNPLAPILNAVQVLRLQKNDNPCQQQAQEVIERQVKQMARLINDLMEISRITTGKVQLIRKDILMNDVVVRAVETTQSVVAEHRHELTVSLSLRPVRLHADADRMEQVLVNLITNAAKYTDIGGHIWLTVQQNGDVMELRVRDSGIGISSELLPRVFDIFSQADQSLARSHGGLGIGLCLVKRIVELHGGKITVDSILGQGSEFLVCIPAIGASMPDIAPPCVGKETLDGKHCRVLVVDDNVDGAVIQQALLESFGHDVRIVHDGHAALEAVLNFQPDVVLLDIGLPGLTGYEVAKAIRQQPIYKNVLLVAVTGYGLESDRQHTREVGFDHHLVKPADFAEVQRILSTYRLNKTVQ